MLQEQTDAENILSLVEKCKNIKNKNIQVAIFLGISSVALIIGLNLAIFSMFGANFGELVGVFIFSGILGVLTTFLLGICGKATLWNWKNRKIIDGLGISDYIFDYQDCYSNKDLREIIKNFNQLSEKGKSYFKKNIYKLLKRKKLNKHYVLSCYNVYCNNWN